MSSLYRVVLLFTISNSFLVSSINHFNIHSNNCPSAPELIREAGYPIEVYTVVTEDGYILDMHRIPHGFSNSKTHSVYGKPVVLIQHGLAGSAADWILFGPGKSLAYLLADAGYDVWLGNNRGNVYSRKHVSLSPESRHFWDFSYHELGIYDLPAMIDYILEKTKSEKIFYIGHSQGTTQFWVMASEKPSYNSKISLMIALAPVAFTGHIRGPVTKLAKLTYTGVWLGELFGYPEIRSRSKWENSISNILCNNTTTPKFLCSNLLLYSAGITQSELSAADLSTIINFIPAGASWKEVVHYGQGYVHFDRFKQYDYNNNKKNVKMYNSLVPPDYNLMKVTAPVAFFNSDTDLLATTEDVNLLKTKLRNVVYHNEMSTRTFNHLDFLWGKYSVDFVYEPILQLLTSYK